MVVRIDVAPNMLQWARARSRRDDIDFYKAFPDLALWEAGERQPTIRQLESFAKATYTPLGFLFLDTPPEERVPVPDFRTHVSVDQIEPSPNLLETIYLCQRRQAWYRDYLEERGDPPKPFVGSLTTDTPVLEAAAKIRSAIGFDMDSRSRLRWSDAVIGLADEIETSGILVMINGIVADNTRRKLDPDEFRAFTLADPLAPLIFINGADAKAAQIFSLAHEVAHVWLGETGVSNPSMRRSPIGRVELWCNAVAAELLAPLEIVRQAIASEGPTLDGARRIAQRLRVSSLVIFRRFLDLDVWSWDNFRTAYEAELEASRKGGGSGGNYYNSISVRNSRTFARAVIREARAGSTLYKEAFRLLGVSNQSIFDKYSESLGVG